MSINSLKTNVDLVRKTTLFKAVNKRPTDTFPSLRLAPSFYSYAVTKTTSALATINGTPISQALPNAAQGAGYDAIFDAGITAHGYTWSGALWSTSTTPTITTAAAYMAAGNGRFVLAGRLNSGNIPYYSADGLTWTAGTGFPTTSGDGPIDAQFVNGYFVLPTSTSAYSSTDGVAWSANINTTSLTSITYGASKFVRTSANGTIQYSTLINASSPSVTTIATTALYWGQGNSIAFGNGIFVATGDGLNNVYSELRVSTDAVTWAKRGPIAWASRSQFTGVAYSGTRYIAVGTSAATTTPSASVSYSTDGVLWTVGDAAPFGATGAISGITYVQSKFIAAGAVSGSNGTLATSTTGATWSYPTSSFATAFGGTSAQNVPNAIAYGNSQYVVTTAKGSTTLSILTSIDLVGYTTRSFASTSTINNIAFGNGVFVAVGNAGLAATNPSPSAGTAWTLRTSGFGTSTINNVEYLNSNFIAFGNAGKISRSSDTGATWSLIPSQVNQTFTDGTYGTAGAAKYIAVNSGGGTTGIVVSTDLVAWLSNYVPTPPSFVASAGTNLGTGTTGTVNLPTAGVTQNDVMIVAISSTGSLAAVPAGWTSVAGAGSGTSNYLRVIYKVMGATPDTTVAITGISTSSTAVAQAFRNVDTTTPIDVAATTGVNSTASTTLTFASVTPVTGQAFIVGVGGSKSASTFTSASLTNLGQQAGTTQAIAMGSLLLQVPAATTPTLTSSVSATNTTASIALRPINTAISSGSTNAINAVTYGTGSGAGGTARYVAGGTAGTNGAGVLRDSTDGLTWTARTVAAWGTGGAVQSLVFGNGTFVAVGSAAGGTGLINYSTDGTSWVTASVAGAPLYPFSKVIFDGTGFVATMNGGAQNFSNQDIWYSSDGISWYLPNGIGSDATPSKILEANGNSFVAAGNSHLSMSTNGTSWRSLLISTKGYISGNWNDIAYGLVGGTTPTYVLVHSSSTGGTGFYSTDGLSWASAGMSGTSYSRTITYGTPSGNSAFLAAGSVISRSTSGTSGWTTVYTPPAIIYKIIYENGLFVGVGADGTIVTSSTGLTGSWTARTSGLSAVDGDLVDVIWSGSRFVAVGGSTSSSTFNGVSTMSTDGITWTAAGRDAFTAGEPNRVRFVNNEFWALCAGGSVYRSSDGIYWTLQDIGFGTTNVWDITYVNNLYVAVGESGTATVSTDGTTWSVTSTGTTAHINGVAALPAIDAAAYAAIGGGAGKLYEGYLNSSVVIITSNGETITQ